MLNRFALGCIKCCLIFSLVLMLLLAALMTRLAAGPMEITYLTASVEDALTRLRGDRPVEVGKLEVTWSTQAQEIIFTATDLHFMDKAGNGLGSADSAQFDFLLTDLVKGKLSITRAVMNGGYIEVEQQSSEVWLFTDVPVFIPTSENPPQTMDGWRVLINELTPRFLDSSKRLSETLQLESVSIQNVQILLTPLKGSNLVLNDVSIDFKNSGDAFEGSFKTAIANQGLPQLSAEWKISDGFDRATADFIFKGPNWSSFIPSLVLVPDDASRLDLSLVLTRENGIEAATANTKIGSGTLGQPDKAVLEFSTLEGTLRLDINADTLRIEDMFINTEQFDGYISGEIKSIIKVDDILTFNLNLSELNAKFWTLYPEKILYPSVALSGDINLKTNRIGFDDFVVSTQYFTILGSGSVKPAKRDEPKDPPFALVLNARVDDLVRIDEFLQYWSPIIAPNARTWVETFVALGEVQNITLALDISPEKVTQGVMAENTIDLQFSANNVTSRFAQDLPPISGAKGLFSLKDNAMKITLLEGVFAEWKLSTGEVHFPQLSPQGADMHIRMEGAGPIAPLYKVLSDSALDLETTTGFAYDRFSGTAEGRVNITRPNAANVKPDDVRFEAKGRMKNTGLTNVLEDYDILDAQGTAKINNEGMWIEGFGHFESIGGEFTWHSDFLNNEGSHLTAKGDITPSNLAEFGMPARGWLNGNIQYWATGHITAAGNSVWAANGGLRDLEIDLPWIRWSKTKGTDGNLDIELQVSESGDSAMKLGLTAEGADARFEGALDNQLRLISGDLSKLMIDKRVNLGASIRRTSESSVVVVANGAYLNLENILAADSIFYGDGGFAMPQLGLTLQASIDTLHMRDGLFLDAFETKMVSQGGVWRNVKLSGQPDGKGDLSLQYTDLAGQSPMINLTTSNAGFALDTGLLIPTIEGGRLNVEGSLFDEETQTPGNIQVEILGGKLVDMPFLTHILTLGSLRGIADTLGGDGILFSKISAPISLLKDRMVVTQGRASGPALGITAQGWLDFEGGIRMDGVLVPSYNVNSALKAVPGIGDLIVGRSGEGILSIGYYVRGTVDKAQIAVNPLSALTPGILRRIFESPNDTYVEEVLTQSKTGDNAAAQTTPTDVPTPQNRGATTGAAPPETSTENATTSE